MRDYFGGVSAGVAGGLRLRHDHGSIYMTDDFQQEVRFLEMESSPALVHQSEDNGCIERIFRTLKEQLLWVQRFRDLEQLRQVLQEFRLRYTQHRILERLRYQTSDRARCSFGGVETELVA